MKDTDQYLREPARMLLDVAGQSVTIVSRTQTGRDEYNDPVYDETTTTTDAELVIRGTPTFERRIDGVDDAVQAVAWIMDDAVDPSTELSLGAEDDDQGRTELEFETHEFVLHNWFDEGNGKLRLHLS